MTSERAHSWNSPTAELAALESDMTGAAREILDRHVRDLRIRVVREAFRAGSQVHGRVDATEVNEAISRIQATDRLVPQATSDLFSEIVRPMVLRLAGSLIGGALVFGVLAVVIREASWSLVLAGAIAGTLLTISGFMAAFFVFELGRTRRWRSEHGAIIASREFVRRLATVEDSSLNIAAHLAGAQDGRSIGLRRAHEVLKENGVWSAHDVDTFRQLLRLRNEVVHEDSLSLSDEDLMFAMAELSRLWELLREPAVVESGKDRPIAVSG